MKKIIFLISELNYGGTQKTVINLIEKFSKDNFFIDIITFEKKKKINFYNNKKINYIPLDIACKSKNKLFGVLNNINRIFLVRRIIKKKQNSVLICFLPSTNIIGLLANFFLKNKIIISERNDTKNQPIGYIWSILRIIFYRFANAIVCNSKQSLNYLNTFLPKKKIKYIPNHIGIKKNLKILPKKIILSIGRMHLQKGFDILINGFKKSNVYKFGWKLILIGKGKEKSNLLHLVNKLNLQKKVKFINFTNPYIWYKKAGIFVLTSRYEGMPNVVLEAASAKLPIILSKGTGGALDYIVNNKSGIILKTNSSDELSKKINKLTSNENLRKRLGHEAFKKIEHFTDFEKIYMYWKKVIIK